MWEPTENESYVAERGLVPVNGGAAVQHEHDDGAKKKDGFVRRDQSWRYVSSDIPSDLLVKVGGVNFHLHKHPMVSRSARLARIVHEAAVVHGADVVATAVVELPDLPGGHGAFELAAKFCYGVMVDIQAANVAALRCAAEYLEMTEELEEGNLAFRAEAFLGYVVASSWQDSVAVLRSCEGLSPWADDLLLVRRCIESVASKACIPPRAVRWAYAGRRSPTTPTAGTSSGSSQQPVPPADWWVLDICELRNDHFVRVVTAVQAKGMRPDLIGAAVTRYGSKWLPGLTKDTPSSHGGLPWTQAGGLQMVVAGEDMQMAREQRMVVESLISIIPQQRDCVSCGFLLRLLRLAVMVKAAPALVTGLEKRVGMQLEQAELPDLLVPSYSYGCGDTAYDVDLVQRLVEQFLVQLQSATAPSSSSLRGKGEQEQQQQQQQNAKATRVARLLDSYLSEVSRDWNLAVSKFQVLAESLPESSRACDDGLYRAIDSYLKAHPAMTEHDRKRLCRAVDCGKLSVEARLHAAQNERLPLRVVVQVLLSEQVKIADALDKVGMGEGSSSGAGRKKKDESALRLEVESVSAKYMELQREVELLQKQVEGMLSASAAASAADKQQSVSGWTAGWRKLGRLTKASGAHENEEERVSAAAAPGEAASKGPRRWRRNSAS